MNHIKWVTSMIHQGQVNHNLVSIIRELIKIEAEQFCIGQTPNTFASEFNPEFNSERDLIQHTLFHCPSPCTEGKPCLR